MGLFDRRQILNIRPFGITLEGRLFVIGGYARLETTVGGLDVAVAVVDTDDDGNGIVVVVHKIHRVSFLPLCGETKILILILVVIRLATYHKWSN